MTGSPRRVVGRAGPLVGLVGLVVLLAVVALGCSDLDLDLSRGPSPTIGSEQLGPWADESAIAGGLGGIEGTAPVGDPVSVPVLLDDRAEVVEEDCYGTESRCGVVLVPQVEGSLDLVAVGFRVWNEDTPGDPVVVVEWGGAEPLDGGDFPERPVILIGQRGRWPGGPGLQCPGLRTLTAQPTTDQVFEVGVACRARLADAGLLVAGASPRAQVSDLANTVAALGHRPAIVVAAGVDVDLVAGLSAVLDVERAVYVNPVLPDAGSAGLRANILLTTLAEAWRQCEQAPACELAGSLEEFFDAIASLDEDPLTDPEFDDWSIDGTTVLDQLQVGVGDTRAMAAVPELHRAILDRDTATVDRFLRTIHNWDTGHQVLASCWLEVPGDAAESLSDAPPALVVRFEQSLAAHLALCEGLGIGPEQRPDLVPGAVVQTRSVGAARVEQAEQAGFGPVTIEPTVGWPSRPCLVAAVAAELGVASPDRREQACQGGMRFVDRDEPIVLVDAVVPGGTGPTLALSVPEGWVDDWPGYWERDAGIADLTSLSAYWSGLDDEDAALDELLWDYGIVEEDRRTRTFGGQTWQLAQGPNQDGTHQVVLAVAEVDGTVIVVELWAEQAAADQMISEVLVPALASLIAN